MKKLLYVLVFLSMVLSACGLAPTAAPTPTVTETPTIAETPTPLPTDTPTITPTPLYPSAGYGPTNFPPDVDPLTGLKVTDPTLLERRPMVIKVANLPRYVRPQWGLSLADIVFEYYTEVGETRFAAVFLGNNADMVGPIRSGRFIDSDIVRGYKAIFAFGYAYQAEMHQFLSSEFADRLVVEGPGSPLFRYDPNGYNYLVVKTADLSAYITKKGLANGRQDLDGMSFNLTSPAGGQSVNQIFVRYSGEIYNRWDYDPTTGKYLRYSDTTEANNLGQAEQYAQLTDRLTNQPIAFDNMVVLYASYDLYSPGIYDIQFSGSGSGYAFRDGQVYQVKWQRNDTDVVSLTNPDGTPFAFKPGDTWFEVVGLNTTLAQTGQSWRFTHNMP
jgi:hypothetical protein